MSESVLILSVYISGSGDILIGRRYGDPAALSLFFPLSDRCAESESGFTAGDIVYIHFIGM